MGALEMWRHYTTRGHKGPVTCVRANANASIIVTGGVDYSMRVWYENGLFEACGPRRLGQGLGCV